MENSISQNQLSITSDGISFLTTIRKWALFLSVLGFVGSGFMILFGLFFGVIMNTFAHSELYGVFPSVIMMIFYIGFGALYFFPSLFLYRFSVNVKYAIETHEDSQITEALKYLCSFFTFAGILAIVGLALCALVMVGGVIFAVIRAMA
jgi:hypothetical protein